MKGLLRTPVAAALVALAALVTQLPGLGGPLIWDDEQLLGLTDLYTDPARLGEALSSPLFLDTFYWRPLATTSLLAETMVHGGHVWGYRLTAALLHATVSALAFVLLRRIVRSPWTALVGALVFAVHPVHAEVATWPSARFDVLSCLCQLGALTLWPRLGERAGIGRLAGIASLCALGALSKENALLVPVLLLCWSLAQRGPDAVDLRGALRRNSRALGASVIGVAAVLLVRHDILGYAFKLRIETLEDAGGGVARLLLIGRAATTYATTLVFPFGTVGPAHHGAWPIPADDPSGWAGLALVGAFLAGTAWAVRRRPGLGFLLAAFAVSIAPVLQLLPLDLSGGIHAADRFVYLPAFFGIAAVAVVVEPQFSRLKHTRWFVLGALLALAGYKALVIVPRWTDIGRFWTWAAERSPDCVAVQDNLFFVYVERRDLERAGACAERLVSSPASRDAGYEAFLAWVRVMQLRFREAESIVTEALARRPRDTTLLRTRAEVRLDHGDAAGALADYRAAIPLEEAGAAGVLRSQLPALLAGSATAEILATGPSVEARARLRRATGSAEAGNAHAWFRIAQARLVLGRPDEALSALDRAGRIGPELLVPLLRMVSRTHPGSAVLDELELRARASGGSDETIDAALGR